MKSLLLASVAATALMLGAGAPAFADCAQEIATLKADSGIVTGSVNTSASGTAKELPAASTDATGQATAAAPAEEQPAMSADQSTETAAAPAEAPATSASGETPAESDVAAAEPAGQPAEEEPAAQAAASATGGEADAEAVASAEASGNPPKAGEVPGTEATAAMNEATKNLATSPAEVEEQQTAQPAETAPNQEQLADQAAGGPATSPESPTSNGQPVDLNAVTLARAEAYQQAGNEGACMNLIDQVKTAAQ
jgi:hypothetical protein